MGSMEEASRETGKFFQRKIRETIDLPLSKGLRNIRGARSVTFKDSQIPLFFFFL
jgi:hypothetical protein